MRFILRTGGRGTPDFHFDFDCDEDRSHFEGLLNFGLDLAAQKQHELESYAATLWPGSGSVDVQSDVPTTTHVAEDVTSTIGHLR